jgi:hypothetical protein
MLVGVHGVVMFFFISFVQLDQTFACSRFCGITHLSYVEAFTFYRAQSGPAIRLRDDRRRVLQSINRNSNGCGICLRKWLRVGGMLRMMLYEFWHFDQDQTSQT